MSNSFALFLSGIGQWGLVWFVIAAILFFREEKQDHWFFVPFITSTSLVYFLCEQGIKYLILRPRPTVDMGALIFANPGNYSFPSTHATLAFALAYVLSKEEPKLSVWFYILAICISLSRIYLGVHYPTDILGGAVLGIIIGWISLTLGNFAQRRLTKKSPIRSKKIR